MARVSGSGWPWLLADDSERIIGLRAPDNYDTYLVQQWYGAWSSLVTQTASANTATPMAFENVEINDHGIDVIEGTQITVAAGGVYNVQFSAQLVNTASDEHNISIWLARNTANVPNTNTQVTIAKKHGQNNGKTVASWNLFVSLCACDYVQLMWSTPSTAVSLAQIAAQTTPTRPATPSIILTVNRVA